MIDRITAVEFIRTASSGRTSPLIMVCEDTDGEYHEVFCKLSSRCEQNVENLAREVIAVCLAADLGLPVTKPYLVDIPQSLAQSIPDSQVCGWICGSSPVAFGSSRAPNQFSIWSQDNKVSDVLLPTAAAVLTFDCLIQNNDRRVDNPNCLAKGDQIRLIDHDLAFSHRLLLFWTPPWTLGGLDSFKNHIFCQSLSKRPIDFMIIRDRWRGLPDARVDEYVHAIPPEWAAASDSVNAAVSLIKEARDNIDACITEVQRILA